MSRTAFLIVLAILIRFAPAQAATPTPHYYGTFAIVHARLIDGTGRPAIENTTVVVEGDRIASVGEGPPPEGLKVLDATGMTLLPGLIDSHVHLNSVPGSAIRGDSADDYRKMRAQALRSYVASGVTTILDAAAPRDFHAWAAELAAAGHPGPSILMLSPFLTPTGGYFSGENLRGKEYKDLWTGIESVEQLLSYLDAVTAVPNVVGVKVTMERGAGPLPLWPTFDETMRRHIRDETVKRGLPVYAHSMSDDMHKLALELKPKALVHAGYHDDRPTPETLMALKRSGATVTSTLAIYDRLLIHWDRDRLDDPLLQTVTPHAQLKTANDDASWEKVDLGLAASSAPSWTPDFLFPLAIRMFLSEDAIRKRVQNALDGVRQIHEAGIPIVVGTDSGCWPLFTTMFHGPTTLHELELLVQAGLSPMEAIVAATSRPAALHGVDDDMGTIEKGKLADLLLVRGNPDEDISKIRNVAWTIKSGVARSPAGWMTSTY